MLYQLPDIGCFLTSYKSTTINKWLINKINKAIKKIKRKEKKEKYMCVAPVAVRPVGSASTLIVLCLLSLRSGWSPAGEETFSSGLWRVDDKPPSHNIFLF